MVHDGPTDMGDLMFWWVPEENHMLQEPPLQKQQTTSVGGMRSEQ